ncbi:MAG: hypothetical protein BroJett011_48610 [Chloroflexota bacterium]|nr:MAG: hypothetical protein BroJett011_48610 [Chloroflexota bacterium]
MTKYYNLKNIRALLINGFSDEELRRLCFDETKFRPVYEQLAMNTGKAEIVDRLIEYANRTLQFETLLTLARKYNPARFKEHQPYYAKKPRIARRSQITIDSIQGSRSYEDFLDEWDVANFTNRTRELEILSQTVLSLAKRSLIVNLVGPGGIGKSSLLRKFRQSSRDAGQPIVLIEMDVQLSIPKIIEHSVRQLAQFFEFSELQRALNRYKEIRVLNLYSGIDAEVVSHEDNFSIGNYQAPSKFIRLNLSNEDLTFLQWAEKGGLVDLWIQELNKASDTSPIILAFDGVERAPGFVNWIKTNLVENKLSTKILLIISSRDRLGPTWDKWKNITETIVLGPFTEKEGKDFLERKGVTEAELVNRIVARSHGLPWVLAALSEARGSNMSASIDKIESPENYSTFVKMVINHIANEQTRQLVSCASVLRYFDQSILSFVIGEEISDEAYFKLCCHSFIQTRSDYKRIVHQNFQEFFAQELKERNPDKFSLYHKRATEYFKQRLASQQGDWQEATIEIIVHAIQSNEVEGIKLFRELFSKTERFQSDFGRRLVDELSQLRLKNWISQGWILCARAFLALYYDVEDRDWNKWITSLTNLIENKQGSGNEKKQLVAFAGQVLGSIYYRIGQINNSIACYEASLNFYKSLGDIDSVALCLQWLGRNLRLVDQAKSLEILKESLELYRQLNDRESEIATAIQIVVDYRNQGNWAETRRYSKSCVDLAEQMDNPYQLSRAYRNYGTYLHLSGKWEEAHAYLDQALELARQAGIHHVVAVINLDKGNLLRSQGRYSEANTFYRGAISVYTQQSHKLGLNWTLAEQALLIAILDQDYSRAITVGQEALKELHSLGPNSAYVANTLINLAQIYQLEGRFELAFDYYTQAMSLSQKNKFNYYYSLSCAYLARLHLSRGNENAAVDKIELGLKIAEQYKHFDVISDLNMLQGQILLRKNDLNAAIQSFASAFESAYSYNSFKLDQLVERVVELIEKNLRNQIKEQFVTGLRNVLVIPDKEIQKNYQSQVLEILVSKLREFEK